MRIDRDKLHLLHIRDAIEKVEHYSKKLSYAEFAKHDVFFDAIMMQIMVIGEAVNSLSEDFKESHNKMPWHQAVGLRNKTAHGYFDLNPEIIWQIIQQDLPKLKKQVEKLIN